VSEGPRTNGVDVRLLGPLEVAVDGRLVALGGPRQCRLLAVIALNPNTTVPFDRIVDLLWDEPPNSARQQIHNVMSALRRALRGTSLEFDTSHAGYRLVIDEQAIDLHRVTGLITRADEAESAGLLTSAAGLLEDALKMWRGPALAGLAGHHLAAIATRLAELRLTVIERATTLRLRTGESSALIGRLTELVAEHPFQESLRVNLMLALYLAGRHADSLAVYDSGRRLLTENLGIDPGARLRSLHELLLNDNLDLKRFLSGGPPAPASGGAGEPTIRNPSGSPPTGPETPSVEAVKVARGPDDHVGGTGPCFLPRDIAEFGGRETEITQLLALTEGGGAVRTLVISALEGMGGVGKTTLAVHLARRVAASYPDGQYFIDLHGFSLGRDPITASQAMDILLRDAGTPPEQIPAGLEGRVALWRSRVADKRMLLLLDNAADAAQIEPLLPGGSQTLVLVTSRRRLAALAGCLSFSLDILRREEAVALFTHIVGETRAAAEPEAVVAAVELCGRLPLAIRVAAARLRQRTAWRVANLVEQLSDQPGRARVLSAGEVDVMAVLAVSYQHLTPVRQEFLRLLTLLPGTDTDATAAAALAGCTTDAARDHLEALFEDNLLLQQAPHRYRFHDLVAECVAVLRQRYAAAAEDAAARRRLLDHYLAAARTWCARAFNSETEADWPPVPAAAVPQPESEQQALELLRQEYHNLVAAARVAGEQGWHAHCWQLALALQPYLSVLNYSGEAERLYRLALRAAQSENDPRAQAAVLGALAIVCRETGSTAEATELLEQAIALTERSGDRKSEGQQRLELGTVRLYRGDFDGAYEEYARAADLASAVADSAVQAAAANNLGVVCRDTGRFDEALRHFERAATFSTGLGSGPRPSAGLALINVGMTLHLQGRHRAALEKFERALRVTTPAKGHYAEATALVGLANVYRALGRFEHGLAYGRKALGLARSDSLRETECLALLALADILQCAGSHAEAERVYQQSEALAREYEYGHYAAMAAEGLAHVALASGNTAAARGYWSRALRTYTPGVTDAQNVLRHLQAEPGEYVECGRCAVEESARTSPSPFAG
jgi:DNA-binding SARP family transcriptional activator/tetratricopeptide (TPR) repeat protein